jgi:hypothetical protein
MSPEFRYWREQMVEYDRQEEPEYTLAERLDKLAGRLMATTEHHQYAQLVLEAATALRGPKGANWLEPGFLSQKEVMKIAREQRMPKFMYDTEQAWMALAIFAQNVRRKDAASLATLHGKSE